MLYICCIDSDKDLTKKQKTAYRSINHQSIYSKVLNSLTQIKRS